MKYKYISFLCLLLCMGVGQWLHAQQETQCNPLDGLPVAKGEVNFVYGTTANAFSNINKSDIVVGQPLIGTIQSQPYTGDYGIFAILRMAPQAPTVLPSQGDFPDRVLIEWSVDPLGPGSTGGFIITRDGAYLATVEPGNFEFIDFNVQAGEFYQYGVRGINNFGQGVRGVGVGFVNPNGVVSGKITTTNGNPVPGTVVTLSPSIGNSLLFNGIGDNICVSHNAALSTDMFTVSAWVKIGATHDSDGIIDLGSDLNQNFWIHTTPASLGKGVVIGVGDGTAHEITHEFLDDPNTPTIDERNDWHQVAAVYGGGFLILYVDGKFVTSMQAGISAEPALFSIGSRRDQTGFFDGKLDEVRIYDRLLTQTELVSTKDITVSKLTEGLVAYWKFDEGLGSKVFDISYNNMDGALNGTSFSNDTPGIKNGAMTDVTGYYFIEGINYSQEQVFQAKPQKSFYKNYSLEFNAAYQSCAPLTNFDLPDTSHIELTVHPFDLASKQSILSKVQGGTDAFNLFVENGEYKLTINGETQVLGNAAAEYQHLALGLNGTTGVLTYYLNGNLEATLNYANLTGNWNGEAWQLAAKGVATPTDLYTGLIDEVAFYADSLLTLPEIQLHAAEGGNGGTDIGHGSLSSYFDLNEGGGNDLTDSGPAMTGIGEAKNASFSSNTRRQEESQHEFLPNYRFININNSATAVADVDFTDNSTVPISGVVRFKNTFCYQDSVEILVNGESFFPPIFTNEDGRFVADFEPGANVVLTPRFGEGETAHEFFPPFFEARKLNVPIANVLFQNLTVREVEGQVFGGLCRKSVIPADANGDPVAIVKVKLSALNGCYEEVIQLENINGKYKFKNVPPIPVAVSVIEHSNNVIYQFFQIKGGVELDLRAVMKDTADFMYIAPPNVEIAEIKGKKGGAIETECMGLAYPLVKESPHKDFGRQLNLYSNEIRVFQIYDGGTCYLDSFDLTINNGMQESPEQNIHSDTSTYVYEYYINNPNLIAPHTKSMQVVAEVNGLSASAPYTVIVLGQRQQESTFTTRSPSRVFAVLHDPPGDASSATWSKGESRCERWESMEINSGGGGASVELEIGKKLTTFVGLGGGTINEIEFSNKTTIGATFGWSETSGSAGEFCYETLKEISTSDGGDIWGNYADVYFGAALNFEIGARDVLEYDLETCEFTDTIVLSISPTDTFSTEFVYSEWQILTDIIPQLEQAYAATGNPMDSIDAVNWRKLIAANHGQEFKQGSERNISFDAAATYTETVTTTNTSSYSESYAIDAGGAVNTTWGSNFFGAGQNWTVDVSYNHNWEETTEDTDTRTTSVSFTLADDDLNDFYSADIGIDPRYDTPMFKVRGGESMCPWIPGTRNREEVFVQVAEPVQVNVSENSAAIFNTILGSVGPNGVDGLVYELGVRADGNPDGALISIDGAELVGINNVVPFQFVGKESIQKQIAVEIGTSQESTFEGLGLYFASQCQIQHSLSVGYDPADANGGFLIYDNYSKYGDGPIFSDNGGVLAPNGGSGEDYYRRFYKEFNISAHFVEPCSPIDIAFPLQNHTVTPGNENLFVTLNEYDNQDADLDVVRLQYRPIPGDGSWINILELPVDSFANDPVFKIVQWNMIELKDGVYELRAVADCEGTIGGNLTPGISEVIRIVKETEPPSLFGAPQPADGILTPGDEISITFNEDIRCNTIFDADGIGSNINLNNIALINTETGGLVPFSHVCLNNKIIITPEVQSKFLNGKVLKARATAIEDLAGNEMEVPIGAPGSPTQNFKEWEFLVDLNPLRWEAGSDIEESVEVGNGLTVTRNIVNRSGSVLDYAIRGPRTDNTDGSVTYGDLPIWAVIYPTEGILEPGELKAITFVFDESLPQSDYSTEVNVVGTDGNKAIDVDLRVMCPAPIWEFDPTAYTYGMNFSLELNIQGDVSEDKMDVVAAFINGELRGKAYVEYVPALDRYLAFLTVYSNNFIDGQVEFRIWDADDCSVYGEIIESFPFAADELIGAPNAPQVLHTNGRLMREIPLHAGWNWISFNLGMPDPSLDSVLVSLDHPENDLIKSQTAFASYYDAPLNGWFGSLATLGNISMYQHRADVVDTIFMVGTPLDYSTINIPVTAGWNWIGYLPQNPLTVNEALASITALNGDVIKNQTAFAQYVAGFGWLGNLDYMRPPEGYLMKLGSPGTLTYPETFTGGGHPVENRSGRGGINHSPWTVDPTSFEHTMILVGMLADNGGNITTEGQTLGVFANGEVRGVAPAIYIEQLDEWMFFLTSYANGSGEPLQFKLHDAATGEIRDLQEEMLFSIDGQEGTVEAPKPFTLPGALAATETTDFGNRLVVQPNPFGSSTTIRFRSAKADEAIVTMTDAVGRLVKQATPEVLAGWNQLTWEVPGLPAGVYVIKVETGGVSMASKVVVK